MTTAADTAAALYYTLSTIAQTLAGALAVLVTVILFVLRSMDQTIREAKTLVRTLGQFETSWRVFREGGPEDLAKHFEGRGGNRAIFTAEQWQTCATAYDALRQRPTIIRIFFGATGLSVVTIAVCFVALSFTPQIASSKLAPCLLALTVGLGVICLCLYVWLVAAMVRQPAD